VREVTRGRRGNVAIALRLDPFNAIVGIDVFGAM
jgi:hypothetical protein